MESVSETLQSREREVAPWSPVIKPDPDSPVSVAEGTEPCGQCRQMPGSDQKDRGPAGSAAGYLYLWRGRDGTSWRFLEGAGAGLLCGQYCWHWPRVAGMSWRERCHRRPGVAGREAAVA